MPDDVDNKGQQPNNVGAPVLSAEQMAELTSNITAALTANQPQNEPPANEPPANQGDQGGENKTPSIGDLADAVISKMEASNATQQDAVFNTLWNDKYKNTVRETPGLEEYLNSEDDYGEVRMEKLNGTKDFDTKVKALGNLTKSFKQAMAGGSGRKPIVNTKLDKKVAKNEERFNEIGDKWVKGEYTNTGEFTKDFFAAMDAETASIAQ